MTNEIGVGLIGSAFMGRAHSHAWRTVPVFFRTPLQPRLTCACARDQSRLDEFAASFGWESVTCDWPDLIERPDIQIVDICTPSAKHKDLAVAALRAGKHVLCEKPLAGSLEDATEMVAAAREAAQDGVVAMVGFNYRRVPAICLARDLIRRGDLGEIRHVRAAYMQEWPLDPDFPLLWRFVAEDAGTGALGDMASHAVDLAHFVTDQSIERVTAMTETFIHERPVVDGGGRRGPVTVDDAAAFLARLDGGATGVFEVTRLAPGRKNYLTAEINGSAGSLRFDLERLNELEVARTGDNGTEHAFRRILVTEPDHPYVAPWWPPGHILGWEQTFIHQAADLLAAIASGEQPHPTFDDGLRVQAVLEAVVRSAASGQWELAMEPLKETK